MSYDEYIDMYHDAQKQDCPYRAFTFDVVNSKRQSGYIDNPTRHYEFVTHVYDLLEQEEKITGREILLRGRFNQKLELDKPMKNGNYYNPMVLGDMATYFVRNNSISTDRMLEIFATGLREYNIDYPFHFKTGVYSTDNYIEGHKKLYKGYMPQILERESKSNGVIIDRYYENIDTMVE